MNAVLNHISTHMEDKFYWPDPPFRGKPPELVEVEDKIDRLEARYVRLTDEEPLPWDELEELDDEIKQLMKVSNRIWDKWQQSISEMRKEQITA